MAQAQEFSCGHLRWRPTRYKTCPVCRGDFQPAPPRREERLAKAAQEARRMLKTWKPRRQA